MGFWEPASQYEVVFTFRSYEAAAEQCSAAPATPSDGATTYEPDGLAAGQTVRPDRLPAPRCGRVGDDAARFLRAGVVSPVDRPSASSFSVTMRPRAPLSPTTRLDRDSTQRDVTAPSGLRKLLRRLPSPPEHARSRFHEPRQLELR